MKTYFLAPDSDLTRNIINFDRKYKKRDFTYDGSTYSGAIAITNGTPDDIMTYLLCANLNGEQVTSIFKPEEGTRYGSINGLFDIIGPNVNTLLIVMDQENEPLEIITQHIERILTENGCEISRENKDKILTYNCTKGPISFRLIAVINGLNQIITEKHCIEDHLIYAGNIRCDGDSKRTWMHLTQTQRDEVIASIVKASRRKIMELFPQQFEAIGLFKERCRIN